jgi:CBS domain-containing protein
MSQDTSPAPGRPLRAAQVADVMSAPLVTCLPSVPLREVAELMTGHRIHAVVVLGGPMRPGRDEEEWGVISELDVVGGACLADPDVPAGQVAGSPPVVVGRDESLERAALLMAEYQTTHLVVVDDGHPAGIVSALDVARALVPERAEPPAAPAAPEPALAGTAGDRLVIRSHYIGGPERDAEILEARGPGGGPPFLVRWEDSGRVSLLYPGSDAYVEGRTGPAS